MEINTLYKNIYPDRNLKQLQIDVIKNLISGNDVLAILATGYGKSICYQLPFLYFHKCVIVVSPLIALMEDQQINLNKIGIPSVCFNSNMSIQEKESEKNLILDADEHKILYMTPEYLVKEEIFLRDLVKADKLCLIAIDEAHCISTWGHDFRKEYQQLSLLKDWIPNIPVLACTATATPKAQKDIVHFLQLDKPVIVKSSFDRPNLSLACKRKLDIQLDILPYIKKYSNDYIIIYAKTRDDTENICSIVKGLNITCEAYHGGLSSKKRKEVHNGFINGTYRCIVATIAFGMGIDQNVHLIIHYGIPNDMESYYQEIGRAGRDGLESECVLFWSDKDLHVCRALLKDINNDTYRKFKEEQIKLMEKWAITSTCRKKIILKHFGENKEDPCLKCDNCFQIEKEKKKIYNPESLYWPSYLIMKTLFIIKRRGIGGNKIIDIIRGSKGKHIADFQGLDTYSKGFTYGIDFLKELIRLLIFNNYLREVSIEQKYGTILMTTEKTVNWWYEANKYTQENEMNYIKWSIDDIPSSFELIRKYLPRSNTNDQKLKRRTVFQKTLDMFDMDESGEPHFDSALDNGIEKDESLLIQRDQLLIQTVNISTIKTAKDLKKIKVVENENEKITHSLVKVKKNKVKTIDKLLPANIMTELDI